ncbi:MAG: hypothetical protein CVU49_08815 [Candidatus Cloacimonetes bacterium HGW-Cloacimonetes-2]|nr:MAG: hypothetical protein CVU49_08815 [Candidatus Cloacimonetes bacterium HGW-Cloacimonetes-2]
MKISILIIIATMLILPVLAQHCGSCPSGAGSLEARNPNTPPERSQIMGRAGAAHWINENYYISYEWNKTPRIGNRILLIRAFDKNRRPVTNLRLSANAYMPSMRGAHDTGDKPMQLNRSNRYAIPVNFMMLGDWEIEIKVNSGNSPLGKAYIRLNI